MKNKDKIIDILESRQEDDVYIAFTSYEDTYNEIISWIEPNIKEFAEYYFEKQLKKYKETGTVLNDASKTYLEFYGTGQ